MVDEARVRRGLVVDEAGGSRRPDGAAWVGAGSGSGSRAFFSYM